MTDTVPLNKLLSSPRNVRKTAPDEDIESLAESIASNGLLQNLVVSRRDTGRGFYEVEAGGRRHRALQLLREQKRIAPNYPVPVLVIDQVDAPEASLAENLQKVAMNPADEVEAFETIIRNYSDDQFSSMEERIANCARRFGRTPNYVQQRLRLAALAPDILTALREGVITVQAAKAYASHPDHELQMRVFEREQRQHPSWRHQPNSVRQALDGKVYPIDHAAVKYVGIEAYRDAGGRIEADLFFDDGDREILLDPGIIDRLFKEKAEKEAQGLAQADGWLDAVVAKPGASSWSPPPAPKGFISKWGEPEKVGAPVRRDAALVYQLKPDGSSLQPSAQYYFVPKPDEKAEDVAEKSPPIDWEARRRNSEIAVIAARMSLPKFAGTPFEGRVYWPGHDTIYEHDFDEEGYTTIAAEIAVSRSDIEAHIEAAEAEYERLLAADDEDEDPDEPKETDPDGPGDVDQPEPEEVPA